MRAFRRFIRDARGGTAIEYGFIVAMVVIVIVVSIRAVGSGNGGIWSNMTAKVVAAGP